MRELLKEGASAGEIRRALSEELGFSGTRSAVIGKVNRLGLSFARAQGVRDLPGGPRLPRTPRKASLPPAMPRQNALEASGRLEAEPLEGDPLSEEGCRWPSGDVLEGTFAYCRRPRSGKSSFCEVHRAVAVAERKKRKQEEPA